VLQSFVCGVVHRLGQVCLRVYFLGGDVSAWQGRSLGYVGYLCRSEVVPDVVGVLVVVLLLLGLLSGVD